MKYGVDTGYTEQNEGVFIEEIHHDTIPGTFFGNPDRYCPRYE